MRDSARGGACRRRWRQRPADAYGGRARHRLSRQARGRRRGALADRPCRPDRPPLCPGLSRQRDRRRRVGMAFFRNSAVNLLNLHYAIHAIALNGGAAFFTIYLLKSGVPVPGVLVSIALILLGRFAIRPIV